MYLPESRNRSIFLAYDFHQGCKFKLRAQEGIQRNLRKYRTKRSNCFGRIEWFRKDNFSAMLMGQVIPDEGKIEKPEYATVGYLPQDGISISGAFAS